MIIPGLFYQFFKKAEWNLAWIILFLNFFVFLYSQIFFSTWPSASFFEQLNEKKFSQSVVEMYRQTLDPLEKMSYATARELRSTDRQWNLSEALRDHRFWSRAQTFPFHGDALQIEHNRKLLLQLQTEYFQSAQYQLGLGSLETSPWAWVTYQFTHASWVHLIGNMIVIFLLVSYLELSVGFFWIATVYLFGGFAGGISYLIFDGSGSLSVVGASASACALMTFLLVTQKNVVMPWSYLIAPVPEGYGVIYLPVFFIFPLYILADFLTALWEPSGLSSSIAVSAHIGGSLAGLGLGVFYWLELQIKNYLVKNWVLAEVKVKNLD